MRSGLVWVVVVLAIAGAWFLFNPGDTGEPREEPIDASPAPAPDKKAAPRLMGSGGTRPIVPTEIRGRGMIQGVARISGEGVPADIELRHVIEVDPANPFKGGLERMFIERMLDSGISGKDAIGRTSTGSDGRFKFKGLAPGLYEVRATAGTGAMGFASGMLPAHGARVEVNVDIPAGDQTLTGRVTYADGKPFEGLVVATPDQAFPAMLMGGGSGRVRPTRSDKDGRFAMPGLAKGRYQISAIIPGALRVMGAPIDVPYSGEYELKILIGGVTVKGKVISAETEQPVAGARVFGGGGNPQSNFSIFSTLSGEDGRFEMTIPAGGGGGMFVRAAGYAPQMVNFRGGISEDVIVTLLELGSIRGRVTAQEGGAAAAGVTVFATGGRGSGMGFGGSMQAAKTDADGRFTLDEVAPGPIKLHAIGGGWASVGLTGMGFGEAQTPYVVEIEPGGSAEQDLEVIPSGMVKGRVLSADGRPVPGAVVQAGGPNDVRSMISTMMGIGISFASDVTDGDGNYVIDAIVPGTSYSLGARAPEHPDARSETFTGAAGKTHTIDITFAKARWFDVRVVDPNGGAPVPGATLQVHPKRAENGGMVIELFGAGTTWTTDGDGKARVGPLPEGELELAARAAGYIQTQEALPEDRQGTLTVELQKGLVIAGRIQLPEGIPAQSIRVTVQRDMSRGTEWFHERAAVDAEGRFKVDTIKSPGEYKVSARGQWQERAFKGEVRVDAGSEDVVLELRESEEAKRASFDVLVTDADGKPVPAGRVQMWRFADHGNGTSTSRTRINNGKATFQGFQTDGELWVEVFDLVGGSRGATIQGPVTIAGGKLEVRLPRSQSIAGRMQGPDGKPVAGVRIEARPVHPRAGRSRTGHEHAESVSDGKGRFELKGLGPLEYSLRFSAPSEYAPVPEQKVQAGETQLAVVLRAGAKAVLTLVDYAGQPVARANAWLRAPQEGERSPRIRNWDFNGSQRVSDAKGVLTLSGLEPGVEFDLTISVPPGRDDLRQIVLAKWTPADETLTFARAYTISGTVRTKDGKVPRDLNIRHRKPGATRWNWGANVSADGTFTLKQLEAGPYELKAEGGGVLAHAELRRPGEAPPPDPNIVRTRAGAKNVVIIVDLGATLTVKIRGVPREGPRAPMNAFLRTAVKQGSSFIHGQWTRSDTVEFRGLKPDATYTLWIGGIAGGKYVHKEGVRAQDAELRVDPKQGGKITGVVKIPAEAGSLEHISVSAHRLEGGLGRSASVERRTGTFVIDGLPEGDGEWNVSAQGWGDGVSWTGEARTSVGGEVEIVLKRQESRRPR